MVLRALGMSHVKQVGVSGVDAATASAGVRETKKPALGCPKTGLCAGKVVGRGPRCGGCKYPIREQTVADQGVFANSGSRILELSPHLSLVPSPMAVPYARTQKESPTMSTSSRRRAVTSVGVLLAGLSAGSLGAHHAQAAFIGCRSDPIVILSNGVVLDLSANIADDVSDIKQISYVLQAPQGVTVLDAISTDGPVGYRENFQLQSSGKSGGQAGVYQVQVQVKAHSKDVSVTAVIAGGDADALGITPDMVSPGATSFTPVDADDAQKHTKKGPSAPVVLPSTVIDSLNAWAQSAAWTTTASTTGTADKGLVAVISL